MIDDDRPLRNAIGPAVSINKDWKFFSEAGAKEGLAAIDRIKPDIIILDFDLGEGSLSGFELLRALRADVRRCGLPVIMLTGALIDTADKVVGLELGADDFLVKPVSIPVLLARAKAAILKARRGADA